MSKTLEEMAEEFFENWQPEKPKYIRPKARQYALEKVTECFLAGYQAAMNSPEKPDSCNSSNNSNGSACCHDMSSYLSDSYLEIARDGAEREVRKQKNGEWTDWSAEANVLLALLNERKERTNLPTSAKWISVKERLPELNKHGYSEDVLLLSQVGRMEVSHIEKVKRVVKWRGIEPVIETENGTPIEYFTHWMPLPEAPKEEK